MRQDISTREAELTNRFSAVSGSQKQSYSNKAKSKKASPRITLRLSEDENARLKHLSQGMTVSAYIRKCIFEGNTTRRKRRSHRPVQDQESLANVLALLGQSRIANNLNQLAHQANMGSLEVEENTLNKLVEAYEHVTVMRNELVRALGLIDKQ